MLWMRTTMPWWQVSTVHLCAAFDMINIELLMKHLRVIILLGDVLDLIQVWPKDKFFFVKIEDLNTILHNINTGTIHGWILVPILYANYVLPLFDFTDLSNFADVNFIITTHYNKQKAIDLIESKLKLITKWLTSSGF